MPFYLRHGKRLPKGVAEIAIQFKAPPAVLFAAESTAPLQPNVLVLRIQPDEGIAIRMNAKVPGQRAQLAAREDGFPLRRQLRRALTRSLRTTAARRDYRRLDICSRAATKSNVRGRSSTRSSTVGIASPAPYPYESGTWGPPEADEFIERDGREWRRP